MSSPVADEGGDRDRHGRIRAGVRCAAALSSRWAVLAVGLLVVGYFLVGSANAGPAKAIDLPIARFLDRHRPGYLVPVASQGWLLLVPFAVVLCARLWRDRNRAAAVASTITLAITALGATALVELAKVVAARPRPPRMLAAVADTGYSFPSAHVTVTTAVCITLTALALPRGGRARHRRARRWRWAAAAGACVLMGASRLVLGVHWFTDVAVGAAAGSVWAALCLAVGPTAQRPDTAVDRTAGGRPPARIPHRRAATVVAVLALVAVAPLGRSYERAVTFPGSATWQARSVDWLRAEGAGPVVDWVENYWYSRTPPLATDRPPPLHDPYGAWPRAIRTLEVGSTGPAPIRSPFHRRTRHEATWQPGPRSGHRPVLYTAEWRPDASHPGLVVGALWFDHRLVEPRLVPGTREPGGRHWAWGSEIPRPERRFVVAAFNGGFLPLDAQGGYETEHRVPVRLRLGAASLVIWASGRADVRSWTPSLAADPAVVSVRQNLSLVVDRGRPVPGLLERVGNRWGGLYNQREPTWRSGLGVDRHGNLIYVAGNHITLQTVATALSEAGAVRGMELDIHPGVVTANLYVPDVRMRSGVDSFKLLASMPRPATRYLKPDQRDFVAMVLRTMAPGPGPGRA